MFRSIILNPIPFKSLGPLSYNPLKIIVSCYFWCPTFHHNSNDTFGYLFKTSLNMSFHVQTFKIWPYICLGKCKYTSFRYFRKQSPKTNTSTFQFSRSLIILVKSLCEPLLSFWAKTHTYLNQTLILILIELWNQKAGKYHK